MTEQTKMTEDEMRAQFEKRVVHNESSGFEPPCGRDNCLARNSLGEYQDAYTETAFRSFKLTVSLGQQQ